MAERPAVQVQRMGRDKLALFLPNREAIKAFEHLVDDVATVLPDAALANATAAELAASAAAAAQADADAAQGDANALDIRVTALEAASGASWVEVEIDFGSAPVYGAEFTITDAAISAASKVQVLPCGKAATGRTADDWAWDGAAFAATPAVGSATCYAHFLPGPIVGRRKVQYSVGA